MREAPVDLSRDPQIDRDVREFAIPLAERFWRQVAQDQRVSVGFRQIASGMGNKLEEVKRIARRLA